MPVTIEIPTAFRRFTEGAPKVDCSAATIADALNETLLPDGYFAEEHAHAGARIEIDVATFADESAAPAVRNGTVATQPYAPPAPAVVATATVTPGAPVKPVATTTTLAAVPAKLPPA